MDDKKIPPVQTLRAKRIDNRVRAKRIVWQNWLLLLLFVGVTARAQNVCNNILFPGNFTLAKSKVCAQMNVSVAVPAGANIINAQYVFQYDGKSSLAQLSGSGQLTSATSFNYANPGSFTILQSGSGNGTATGTILCKEITVLPTDAPKFTVKSCAGRRAILVPDASTLGQYDKYEIAWGDGVREQKTRADMANEISHTYSSGTSSVYTVTLQGIYGTPADCRSASPYSVSLVIQGTATQPIISSLKVTGDKAIDISYQASNGSSVQLYQKVNGTYVATGQNGTSSGTFTVQTDASQVQCFEVVTQDACNSPGLTSDEVCSIVPTVKADNKQNTVNWQPYAGTATQFRYYRVFRNGSVVGQINNRNTATLPDANNITCGQQYCYSIQTTVGPTTITSNSVCVTGVNSDQPPTVGSTFVSIEDNKPRLQTTLPTTSSSTSYTLLISRANGPSGTFQPIGTVFRNNTFVDEQANPNTGSYCYQITYQNECGLQSVPSSPVCSVYLSAESANGIGWTTQSPFTPETVGSYSLEVLDSLNGSRQELQLGSQTRYSPDPNDPNLQTQRFRVITIASDGTISYSNFYTFRREARIFIPDAFTPNHDGMNETLQVKGSYIDQMRMTIYDRWGEVVYTTTSKGEGWDGSIRGQPAQAGQYMYRIEVTDLTGLKTVRTGAVLLVR